MKRIGRRVIALVLTLSMLLALIPLEVLAEEETVSFIEAGGCYSAMLDSENKLWIWGDNTNGQLGIEESNMSLSPINIMDEILKVKLGDDHSAIIKKDNSLWLWGDNLDLECGNQNSEHGVKPLKVMEDVKNVDLSLRNTVALKNDGTVWVFGYNGYGQYGKDFTGSESSAPVQSNISNVKDVKSGWDTIGALKEDGSLWLWGKNDEQQLGIDDEYATNPVNVLNNVKAFDLGANHSAAIKTDGSLWMWCSNSYGQIGDGTCDSTPKPKKIMDDVESIELGTYCSAAIKTDGSLWMWGLNDCNQVDSSGLDITTPIKILNNVKQVSLGGFHDNYKTHVLAQTNDGNLWGWGDNSRGQLGDGTTEDKHTPTLITVFNKKTEDSGENQELDKLEEWITSSVTQNQIKTLLDSRNYPNNVFIAQYDGSFGQVTEQFSVDLFFYRGFKGWNDIGSDKSSVSSAEQTLAALLEMVQTDGTALNKTKTAKKWGAMVCNAYSNFLNYQNNSDALNNPDFQKLSSVLGNENKVSMMFAKGNFKSLKKNLIKELKLPEDSPTIKLVDDFMESKELTGEISRGLSWLGTGLNIISVSAETIDRYYQLEAISESNEAYSEMLTYIRDNCGYQPVSKAASNVLEIANGNEEQVKHYMYEAINKGLTDTALNKILDKACDQFPIAWGVKTGLKLGTGIANAIFHTSDAVVLKDSMRNAAFISRFTAQWMDDTDMEYWREKDPETKDKLAKKTAYSFYMTIQARKAGEQAFQKYLESQFLGKSSSYKASKSVEDLLNTIENDMVYSGITPAYLSLVVSCPVDVEVIKDGKVVATVRDGAEDSGKIDNIHYTVTYNGVDQDYVKIFQIPKGSEYQIRAVGNNLGLVNLTFYEPDEDGLLQARETTDIPVNKGSIVTINNTGTKIEKVTLTDGERTTDYSVTDKNYLDNNQFVNVESLKTEAYQIEIQKGESKLIPVEINPQNASIQNLNWKSSNEKVAIVNSDGVVTGLRNGEAEITVASENNPKASKTIRLLVRENSESAEKPVQTTLIYRLYMPINGEHLYTSDKNEKDVLSTKHGWTYEGVGWEAPSEGQAIYRLYNPGLRNHLYTSDQNEINVLTSKHGWVKDNGGKPLFYSGGDIPVYRIYNKGLNGMHHLTTDLNEYNTLPRHGWDQEGISLYAVKEFSK